MATEQLGVSWTAEELLSDVRLKARIPDGNLDYTDSVLLEEATRALWSFAGWALAKAGDGRLVQTLTRNNLLQCEYGPEREVVMPPDAVGDTFDSVVWYNSSTQVEHRLEAIQLWDQSLYDSPAATGANPWGYSISNDGRIRVYPQPLESGELRIRYQRRLPKLVLSTDTSAVRTVTAFASTTSTLTYTYSGADPWLPVDANTYNLFDVIDGSVPYRYVLTNAMAAALATNQVITNTYNSTTIPHGYTTIGQYIVRSGVSPFVHLPLEFKAAVTHYVASQILSDMGDPAGAAEKEAKAEKELARVTGLLSPRVQTTRKKIKNPHSHIRSRGAGRRGWM